MPSMQLPERILAICRTLEEAGFTSFVVGGAVRDALLGRVPLDWDLATDARPEELMACFPEAEVAQPQFGRIQVDGADVMSMRRDGVYRDGRHPAFISFCSDVEEDLGRRDFTVNAVAYEPASGQWIDPYGGVKDVSLRFLRVVGDPSERFLEDHLRMLRAVRFKAVLGFSLDEKAIAAVMENASALARVAGERIRQELDLILLSDAVVGAFADMSAWGLLPAVLPEMEPAVGYKRGRDDLFSHCTLATQWAPRRLPVRIAALFHDVGKAQGQATDHAQISAERAQAALNRLGYASQVRDQVVQLIHEHMFLYPPGSELGLMRRMVLRMGEEGVEDLLELRWADRQASSRKGMGGHAERALSHLRQVLEEGTVISREQMAISGRDIMDTWGIPQGPTVGRLLCALHEAVLDNPILNERETLMSMVPPLLRQESLP